MMSWILVNSDSGYGLLLGVIKVLPKPMLIFLSIRPLHNVANGLVCKELNVLITQSLFVALTLSAERSEIFNAALSLAGGYLK